MHQQLTFTLLSSQLLQSRDFVQVEDLKRFMPQILHIVPSGSQPAAVGNKNVGSAGSLAEVFSFSG